MKNRKHNLLIFAFCIFLNNEIIAQKGKIHLNDSTNNDYKIEHIYQRPFHPFDFLNYKKFTRKEPIILPSLVKERTKIFLTIRDDVDDSTIVCFNNDTIVNSYLKYEFSAGINRKEIWLNSDSLISDNYITIFLVNKNLFLTFKFNFYYDNIMIYFNERYKVWSIKYSFRGKKIRGYY
jgi:hypothetical protein